MRGKRKAFMACVARAGLRAVVVSGGIQGRLTKKMTSFQAEQGEASMASVVRIGLQAMPGDGRHSGQAGQ